MIDFSKLFHQSSKDRSHGGTVRIPLDPEKWPDEWKTTYYKAYIRAKKIPLSDTPVERDFFALIKSRFTRRNFSGNPIDLEKLGTLLKYSCGVINTSAVGHSRAQPSAGGRYPIEVYPIVLKGSDQLPAGTYHYNVRDHSLDVLWPRAFEAEYVRSLFVYDWMESASIVLVLTAVLPRTQMKYGERGYRYALLEAGHIAQNVYLNAGALGLKCCALGGTEDADVEKLLDIDGVHESLVYTVVLG